MVFVVAASIILGRVSDRLQRRKIFVILAAVVQARRGVPARLRARPHGHLRRRRPARARATAAFLSVDQALATQVLPDPHDRGKDLGIMNVASNVPQAPRRCSARSWSTRSAASRACSCSSAAVTSLGAVSILLVEKVR